MDESFYGYDIDGVLFPCKIELKRPCVIITGRSFQRWYETMSDLADFRDIPIYLNPVSIEQESLKSAAYWKAQMINDLGITEFYEDIQEQATIISALAPCCKVVLVI